MAIYDDNNSLKKKDFGFPFNCFSRLDLAAAGASTAPAGGELSGPQELLARLGPGGGGGSRGAGGQHPSMATF